MAAKKMTVEEVLYSYERHMYKRNRPPALPNGRAGRRPTKLEIITGTSRLISIRRCTPPFVKQMQSPNSSYTSFRKDR